MDAYKQARAALADKERRAAAIAEVGRMIDTAYADENYGLLTAARDDEALPDALRGRASSYLFSLDHRPAGPEHRAFLRIHGVRSIDDIED